PFNVVLTATRNWQDLNNNNIPDCDLTNPAAQAPGLAGNLNQIDNCAAASALMWASSAGVNAIAGDDGSRFGWGVRPYSWEFSLSAQHELSRGVSIYGGGFLPWVWHVLGPDGPPHTTPGLQAFSLWQNPPRPAPTRGGPPRR